MVSFFEKIEVEKGRTLAHVWSYRLSVKSHILYDYCLNLLVVGTTSFSFLPQASDESLSGYLAAEESAPVASYGVGPASEDDAASAPLPSYEDDQAQYTSFRF